MDTDKIVAAILTVGYCLKNELAEEKIVEKYYSIRAEMTAKNPTPNAMSITGRRSKP